MAFGDGLATPKGKPLFIVIIIIIILAFGDGRSYLYFAT
jgi:hypothetical protein